MFCCSGNICKTWYSCYSCTIALDKNLYRIGSTASARLLFATTYATYISCLISISFIYCSSLQMHISCFVSFILSKAPYSKVLALTIFNNATGDLKRWYYSELSETVSNLNYTSHVWDSKEP